MTFIERVKLEHPTIPMSERGIPNLCPYDYGYELDYDCRGILCEECWNR